VPGTLGDPVQIPSQHVIELVMSQEPPIGIQVGAQTVEVGVQVTVVVCSHLSQLLGTCVLSGQALKVGVSVEQVIVDVIVSELISVIVHVLRDCG
ncbi:3155_t:CDS:1, partial [Dentiscutata erythropus]